MVSDSTGVAWGKGGVSNDCYTVCCTPSVNWVTWPSTRVGAGHAEGNTGKHSGPKLCFPLHMLPSQGTQLRKQRT